MQLLTSKSKHHQKVTIERTNIKCLNLGISDNWM